MKTVQHALTNRIYHWSLVQTEKPQPKGKWIMLKTRFTKCPALSIAPRVGIMLETRFTEFLALSIDLRMGISQSCTGDQCLIILLTFDIKNY